MLTTDGYSLLMTMKSLVIKENLSGYQPCQVNGKQTNVLRTISTVVIMKFPDNKDGDSS
jgi:hypothetical protein